MNDKIASNYEKEPSLFQLIRGLTGNELRDERASFIIAAVLNLLATLSVLSIPWLIQKVIDEVLPSRDTQGLAVYALIIMAGLILYITLWSVHISKIAGSVERVFYRVREKLMMSILSKRHDFYGCFKEGDLITRVSADVEMVATTFFERAVSATLSFLIAIVIAVTIVIWKWELGLISLASIALYGLLVNKLGEPVSRLSAKVREALSGQNTTAIDLINGEKEIRFFHQQKEMVERFGVAADKFREANTRLLRYTWITLSAEEAIGMIIGFIPFLAGGLLICLQLDPTLSVGVLFAYYTYVSHLMLALYDGVEGITKFMGVRPAVERISEILNWPGEQAKADSRTTLLPDNEKFEFRNVSFSYPGGKPVISDLSLELNRGGKLAIMGGSGSGKSTLLSLLLRFQDPVSGEIMFGGHNIREYSLQFYRSQIGYVRQDTHLFRMTMSENISFGWYNVPEEKVHETARLVKLDDVIRAMPKGYETIYGEGGVFLSGGQKQRMALARAIIRDPALLVLDEFTSALDGNTESEILDMVFELFKDQAIICVTHSPLVAERFDRVIRL